MSKVAAEGKRLERRIREDIAPDLAPKMPEQVAAPVANPAIAARTEAFATREQVVQQRAAGAGLTRTDNDADLLGFVVPKRRSAARTLLG